MDKWKNIRHFNFSRANNYNPNDFRFLVHAIDLPNSILSDFHLSELLNNYGGNYSSSQKINLALTPEKIAEKELISCSLVAKSENAETLETYKPFGFIIKCPIENIIFAGNSDSGNSDLGVLYTHPDEVKKKFEDKIILPLENCLFNSSSWNEILVDGATIYGKAEIDGIFVNLGHFSMNDDDYAKRVIEEAKKLGHNLGVPLVYFPRRKYIIEDKPIEIIYDSYPGEEPFLKEISFNKNGKKFRLYVGHSNTPVLQSSTNEMMKPMIREDFILFMDEIQKLSRNELLTHADLIRQLPQIFKSQQLTAEDNDNIISIESFLSDKKQHR